MKKCYLLIVLLFAGIVGFSQTLDDINKMMLLQQNKKAKESIDKFLSDAKNAAKPIAWFYKGRIYNSSSKDSGINSSDALKLKGEAFEALKKYQQMDAKEEVFVAENHVSYFDLYNGYFDIGAKEFNAKNFTASLEGFKNALLVQDYVKSKDYAYNGFKFPALDTSLVINTAIAATQAAKEDEAVGYYKKITDANLTAEQYLNIYEYMVGYYLKKNDEPNLNAMLEKGRKLYPQDEFWNEVEIDKVAKSGNKDALIAKYEDMMKREPTKYSHAYNLSVEMYNMLYAGDNRPANAEALKNKLTEVLKTAITLDLKADAKMLMTRHLYNDAFDYQDSANKIKGAKPADIKRRNDIKAIFLKKVGECIPFAESVTTYYAGLPTLKSIQKANYKIALDLLSQMHAAKGNLPKAAEYDKKKLEVDKL